MNPDLWNGEAGRLFAPVILLGKKLRHVVIGKFPISYVSLYFGKARFKVIYGILKLRYLLLRCYAWWLIFFGAFRFGIHWSVCAYEYLLPNDKLTDGL